MNRSSSVWKSSDVVLLCVAFAGFIALYYPILQGLVADWGVNEDYSHGYFIPFLTAYFIYIWRKKLVKLEINPNSLGLIFVGMGLVQLIVGKVGSEFFIQRTSMIPVLLGGVLYLLGWDFLKKLFYPICYLLFMIPLPAIIWNKIAFPMQLFASGITENVVSFIGIPIYREGNVLHLAETTLEVVAACSGLRSLMTMFALAGALAFLSSVPHWKKWILFFSAAPIAVVANITRLTGTAILASFFGSEVAHGFLHDFSGMVVFIIGLSMLIGVNSILSKTEIKP